MSGTASLSAAKNRRSGNEVKIPGQNKSQAQTQAQIQALPPPQNTRLQQPMVSPQQQQQSHNLQQVHQHQQQQQQQQMQHQQQQQAPSLQQQLQQLQQQLQQQTDPSKMPHPLLILKTHDLRLQILEEGTNANANANANNNNNNNNNEAVLAVNKDISSFKGELTSLKEEMLSLKGNFLTFKDENVTFKGDFVTFKDEFIPFKSTIEKTNALLLDKTSNKPNDLSVLQIRIDELSRTISTMSKELTSIITFVRETKDSMSKPVSDTSIDVVSVDAITSDFTIVEHATVVEEVPLPVQAVEQSAVEVVELSIENIISLSK